MWIQGEAELQLPSWIALANGHLDDGQKVNVAVF